MPAQGRGTLYNVTTNKTYNVQNTNYLFSQSIESPPSTCIPEMSISASITATSRAGTGVSTQPLR